MNRWPPVHSDVMRRLGTLLEAGGWRIENGEVVRPAWHTRAACRGVGTELFFPEDRGRAQGKYQQAREQFCSRCPVVAECAEAGRHEDHGLWGGKSAQSRVA